jgi:hypothetical protein
MTTRTRKVVSEAVVTTAMSYVALTGEDFIVHRSAVVPAVADVGRVQDSPPR